jgi:hypothetical protein
MGNDCAKLRGEAHSHPSFAIPADPRSPDVERTPFPARVRVPPAASSSERQRSTDRSVVRSESASCVRPPLTSPHEVDPRDPDYAERTPVVRLPSRDTRDAMISAAVVAAAPSNMGITTTLSSSA